jgi:acetyl-CoA synthetase
MSHTPTPHLDAYWFHEREWETYDELYEAFEHDVPDEFNIATYICDRWADDRDRIALFAEDGSGRERTYSYVRLRDAANRLANELADRGIERGDRVGVCVPPKPETVIATLAIWKLGAVSVPLTIAFGPDALRYRLEDSTAKACIVDATNIESFREARSDLESLTAAFTVGDVEPTADESDLWATIETNAREFETVATSPDDDAFIIYTSGTTGDPKGGLHAHRSLLGHLPAFLTTYSNLELSGSEVYAGAGGWASIGMFGMLLPALYYGRPVVAYAKAGPFDPETQFELLEKYDVTTFLAPPTALRMMMQIDDPREKYDVDSVRILASGGESVGETVVDWADSTFAGAVVHETYGQTEANVLVGDSTALDVPHEPGKMGKPLPGHEVTVVDEAVEPIDEVGATGEIAVRYEGDPVCFVEYFDDPEKTAAKVQDGWLLTEDLGTIESDGYLTFESRKDSVIISSGYRISPEEVEDGLGGHRAVADSGVIGIPDDERGQVPKAFVVLDEGYQPSDELTDELKEYVKNNLALYQYPREIEYVSELPKTPTEKIARADLRQREGL